MKKFYIAAGMAFMLATPATAQDATLVFTALDTNKDGKVSPAEAQKT